MLITKQKNHYHTQDGQHFPTYAGAIGHTRRLAIAHYLQVVRHKLHEDVGPLSKDQIIFLRQIGDAIEEIFEEKPALEYLDGRKREQTPIREAA